MTNVLNSLRIELNRERAYVRSTRLNIKRGVEVGEVTKIILGIRWHNTAVLKKAIKDLKKIRKPEYQFLKADYSQQ